MPPPRSPLVSCGASAAPTSDAEVEQARLPHYDVGALKALFHHAQAVLEEKRHTAVASGRGRSRGSISSSSVDPRNRGNHEAEALPTAPPGASGQSSRCQGDGVGETCLTDDDCDDEDAGDRDDGKMISELECQGATAVTGTMSGPEKVVSRLELARTLGETVRRVSDLEARILPRGTSDDGASSTGKSAGAEEHPIPESFAPGAGGAFSRLVVVKELQPVPEHAPEDARHLLELTLDHQQVICLP